MTEYSPLDAELTRRIFALLPPPEDPPAIFWDAPWWTPDGIGTWDDVQTWYEEETYRRCPYFIASNGGPKDLPGRFGPGTCGGSCWEEPECMTIGPS